MTGAQVSSPTNVWTYDECTNQCDMSGACVGIKWQSSTGNCWLISDNSWTNLINTNLAGIALYFPTTTSYFLYYGTGSGSTFTATCATCVHTVLVVGGGGSGGAVYDNSDNGRAAGGGGAGGVVVGHFTPSAAGASYTVSVGSGGAGNTGGSGGNNGGSSQFSNGGNVNWLAFGGGQGASQGGSFSSSTYSGGSGGGNTPSSSNGFCNVANGANQAGCRSGLQPSYIQSKDYQGGGDGGAQGYDDGCGTSGCRFCASGGGGAASAGGTPSGNDCNENVNNGYGGDGYTWSGGDGNAYAAGGGGGAMRYNSNIRAGAGGSPGSGGAGYAYVYGSNSCGSGNDAGGYGSGGGGAGAYKCCSLPQCADANRPWAGGSGSAGIVVIKVAAPAGAGRRRELLALGGRAAVATSYDAEPAQHGGRTLLQAQSCAAYVVASGWSESCVASPPPMPPPSPPRPPARPKVLNPVAVVSAAVGLGGYTAAGFDDVAQAAFAAGIATHLGVATDDVAVTSVQDYQFGSAAGRRLLAAGASVAFAVNADSGDTAAALTGSLNAVQSNPAALAAALSSAGLPVDASSLEVTQSAATALKPPSPPGVVPPTIGAIVVSPGAAAANPAARITLSADVTSAAPAASMSLRWSVVPASALNLSDPTRVGTPPNSATLGLLPGALAPGVTCTFRLSVSDAFGNASATVTVATMSVPTGGIAAASSANGTELSTLFNFSTANWVDVNTPLQYSFSVITLAASDSGAVSTTLLADFGNSTSVTGVLLPAGTNVVQVLARNSLGGVSTSPATVTVTVARQEFVSADAQASFIGALISSSLGSGSLTAADATATVALVGAIASMLNDPSSLLSSNASAAADTRASLLNLVGSAALLATTSEGLASAADAVSTLVSNASQISAAGAATALDALLSISSGGAGGSIPLSAAASAGVATGLSSIASAALVPGSAVSPSVLATVAGVVSSLASNLLSALTTPGAAPVTVSSPLIQLSVALDTAGPDSRLFSAPLSAPGSQSSFAPLPAGLFGGGSRRRRLLADAGVRTLFSSLAFDPHTQGASNAGITTLAFSTAAGELNVSGLSVPIRFALPPVPLSDGAKAQCQWWNKAMQSYSIVGCSSLPDPLPPGHNVSWKPGFTVNSDAELAAAWSITGPLVAAPSQCVFEVLDCSVANNTRAVFPNPARPFDFPAVRCNASISTEPILVISGSTCALIQEDNAYGCFWNNAKHAFEGAGCVASGGPVQCACRHLTEFAGKNVPALPTADLSEMMSLSPADLLTKLKRLFIAVICLFCGMHVGAGVAFVQDAGERRRLLSKLQLPDVGFEETKDGAWCVHARRACDADMR